MDKDQALEQFNKSDTLYREGRYAEALAILDGLNNLYPGTPNIMLPRARCLYRMKRIREAVAVCDALISQHKNERAVRLKQVILEKANKPAAEQPELSELPGAFSIDDLLGPPPPPPPPKVAKASGGLSSTTIMVIAVVGVLVLLTVVAMMLGGGKKPTSTTSHSATVVAGNNSSTAEDAPAQPTQKFYVTEDGDISIYGWALTNTGWAIVGYILTFLVYAPALYLTLRVSGKLPDADPSAILINIGTVSAICALLNNFTACFGLIGSIIILRKNYELEFLEFFILFAFSIATGLVVFGLMFFVVFVFAAI